MTWPHLWIEMYSGGSWFCNDHFKGDLFSKKQKFCPECDEEDAWWYWQQQMTAAREAAAREAIALVRQVAESSPKGGRQSAAINACRAYMKRAKE